MLSYWGSQQFWEYRFWCCSHFTEVELEDQRDCDPPKLSSLPRRAAGGHTECEAKPVWKLGHLNSNLVPLMVSHWRNKISEQTKTNTHTHIPSRHSLFLSLVAKSCLTLCNPTDCSLPGSSAHGILQTRILEWVAILFSRGSSRHRNQTRVSCIVGRFFTNWATRH